MKGKLAAVIIALALFGCYPEEWADVSPDGKSLLLSNLDNGVYHVTLDGKQARKVAESGWNAKFSPDGRHCVFTDFGGDPEKAKHVELVLSNLETDTREVLTSRPWDSGKVMAYFLPAWRPDGRELAYATWGFVDQPNGADAQATQLHVLNFQSKQHELLAENVGIHAAWSPDGKRLAFLRATIDGDAITEQYSLGSLVVWDGKNTEQVATVLFNPYAHIAWLSDDRVLFGSPVVRLPAAGKVETPLEEMAYVFDLPAGTVDPVEATRGMSWQDDWPSCLRLSPDGKRLLFGEKTGGDVRLSCYDFAKDTKSFIAERTSDGYPFWISTNRIGYYEADLKIVIAEIDAELQVLNRRSLNLADIFEPETDNTTEPAAAVPAP